MPTGSMHGWGIAGTRLHDEISRLKPVEGVTLHCIAGHDFLPFDPDAWDRINIGYCFFEHDLLASHYFPDAAQRWDYIVTGSRWCEERLRAGGVTNCTTILQGIDHERFKLLSPCHDNGRFVVFSGGKFEFRKGQDIAIAAMRIFMERHKDVWFSCAWHNQWPASVRTMQQSRLIEFCWKELPIEKLIIETLQVNGIDLSRVVLHPPMDNRRMPFLYGESDVGLFPNRCEGGNNMVMCEYMACGRPVIATTETGHADVVTPHNAYCLTTTHPVTAQINGQASGTWFEASVDDVVEQLERAYLAHGERIQRGEKAASDMMRLSWDAAARQFHALAIQLTGDCCPLERQVASDELFHAGKLDLSEIGYRSLLAKYPLNSELHNRLGTVLDRKENFREAIGHYWKALSIDPRLSIARYNLANTLRRMGDECGALENLQLVTEEDPTFPDAWKSLSMMHISRARFADAALCFEKLLAMDPGDFASRCALGAMYVETGRFSDAVTCFDEVLATQPGHLLALESKGTALHELDDLAGAEACFLKLLAIDPDRISALNNLGTVIRSKSLPKEAITIFNRALALEPDNGQVRFNRAVARMTLGELPQAWEDYEFRFLTREPARLYHNNLPRWQGEQLAGRRLLVQSEQGFGDTFQFVRYLLLLSNSGGPVVFECQNRSVKAAIAGLSGLVDVVARDEPLPPVDCQIPLLSLPFIFQTSLVTIPSSTAYLKPPSNKKDEWRERLRPYGNEFKVGLVWGGNKYSLNANRSLHLSMLAHLFALPGVRWLSLQLGPDADQLEPFREQVTDLREQIHDFGDTSGIIANLDLVLTIDSAVAHLAGALGAQTWVMLKYAPDWRWFLGCDDSLWYPSMRLFRQKEPANWGQVAESVHVELRNILTEKISKV